MNAESSKVCSSQVNQPFVPFTERPVATIPEIEIAREARSILEAERLVDLGARASLVYWLTGLQKKKIAYLYPQITGKSSPPGQAPFSDVWYRRNNQRRLHANSIWLLFQHFTQSERSPASIMISVYEIYQQVTNIPILDLPRIYLVPRLMAMKIWHEQLCDYCNMSYVGRVDDHESTCPACTEYFHHRCRSCGAALKYYPLGRRKITCSTCQKTKKRSQKPRRKYIRRHLKNGSTSG